MKVMKYFSVLSGQPVMLKLEFKNSLCLAKSAKSTKDGKSPADSGKDLFPDNLPYRFQAIFRNQFQKIDTS